MVLVLYIYLNSICTELYVVPSHSPREILLSCITAQTLLPCLGLVILTSYLSPNWLRDFNYTQVVW